MQQYYLLLKVTFFVICFAGCAKDSSNADLHSNGLEMEGESKNIVELLSVPNNFTDLSDLLSTSDSNSTSLGKIELSEFYENKVNNLEVNLTEIAETEDLPIELNGTTIPEISSFPSGSIESDTIRSLEKFENDNAVKDATIASLKELNRELLDEIKFLREFHREKTRASSTENDLQEVTFYDKNQFNDLTNKLSIQQNQINDLLSQNENLEKKVLQLSKNPYSKVRLSAPISLNKAENAEKYIVQPFAQTSCSVQFDAVVTSINGRNKEAFYTEFFLLKKDLEDLLLKSEIQLSDYSKIDSYSELWARSRKNPFLYPGVQKKIRTLLLNEINQGQGRRIRTDIDGAGTVNQIESGDYYIIGSAALGKIGVTWNTPINVTSGLNKLSLTLANSSWSL
ncbi:MAG: hypothetical protein VX038_00480 [Verrucomicrobiota bacterium]|nr:hypothetical protein [Verrucomicrobiota bacterium]